jgi:hypothetical protein
VRSNDNFCYVVNIYNIIGETIDQAEYERYIQDEVISKFNIFWHPAIEYF